MTDFFPCPKSVPPLKPQKQYGTQKWNSTIRINPSAKPLKRSSINPRKLGKYKIRRIKEYAKYLRSPEWQALRQEAFKRDGGLCQCSWCIAFRKCGGEPEETRINVWFRKGSKKVLGFDAHHVRYAKDIWQTQLSDVLCMIPKHHDRVEEFTGKRRNYLTKGAA